jgi:hypothetical protein
MAVYPAYETSLSPAPWTRGGHAPGMVTHTPEVRISDQPRPGAGAWR